MGVNQGFEAWIDRYIAAGRARHDATTTLRGRAYHLKAFARWCKDRDIQDPLSVQRITLEAFQRWLFHYRKKNGQPLKQETQMVRLVNIRGFFAWLHKQGHMNHNPSSALEMPRKRHQLPNAVLTLEEIESIMEQPRLDTPAGLRDRAIIETLFSTGIRRQELVGLQLVDLDLDGETLWIRFGKGGSQRRVPIGQRALQWLEKYLIDARPLLVRQSLEQGWMFLNAQGKQMNMDSLTKRLSAYVRQAGIEKRGACHIYRHAAATLMLEGGADIRYIQELLGHRSLDTTQVYTYVSPKQLKIVHNHTHPLAKLTLLDSI